MRKRCTWNDVRLGATFKIILSKICISCTLTKLIKALILTFCDYLAEVVLITFAHEVCDTHTYEPDIIYGILNLTRKTNHAPLTDSEHFLTLGG